MKKYILDMMSEAPGEPSVRRWAFAFVILSCVILCFAGLRWKIPDNVKNIALALIAAATTGVTAGRFAEGMDKRGAA